MRISVLLCAAITALLAGEARAEEAHGNAVKVVVHGGSVSAFRRGGYSQWLPAACRHVEVDNLAQEKLGAKALRARFAQWLHPRKLDAKSRETWLVFLGGVNSIGLPESTNLEVARTFELAHDAGIRTMGLTITPWGSERDTRWKGAAGLVWFAKSQKAVDFMMGRLTPLDAFGQNAETRSTYLPGQLPEIAIDLWDSFLRHRSAPARPHKAVAQPVRSSSWVQSKLDGLDGAAREAALEDWTLRAAKLPQWFLRPELIGSDPVHPNSEGHKQIARAICRKAPPSWGCDCRVYDGLVWDAEKRNPVPRNP
jgi:hypothetical protein